MVTIKRFTRYDQLSFACLSQDHNPIHIDPIIARRRMYGQQVVHGVNALLWSLAILAEHLNRRTLIDGLHCSFLKPILLETDTVVLIDRVDFSKSKIEILQFDNCVARLVIRFRENQASPSFISTSEFPEVVPNDVRKYPLELTVESIASQSGSLALFLNVTKTNDIYGSGLLDIFGQAQIAEIIVLTRLVGMYVPGLHSIFTDIDLKRSLQSESAGFDYQVLDFDTRFNLATIICHSSNFESTLKAFLSPSSVKQSRYTDVCMKDRQLTVPFQRALVIGGSRGLGEVTVKLLAAGEANVLLTYSTGEEDAKAIVDDIISQGGKACAIRFDVSHPIDATLVAFLQFNPTHVYFFATPYIFSGHKGVFSYEKFESFSDFYIDAFNKLVRPLITAGTRNFFYPSTVAIDELPDAMGEYTVAKAAAEVYCKWMTHNQPHLTIFTPRLPRLATDQTVSILNVDNQSSEVMIEYLAAFLEKCQ